MEPRVTTYSEYAMSTNVHGIKDLEAQTLNGISGAHGVNRRNDLRRRSADPA
jgi:hypothetical protein